LYRIPAGRFRKTPASSLALQALEALFVGCSFVNFKGYFVSFISFTFVL
jgi:hypothetical protein